MLKETYEENEQVKVNSKEVEKLKHHFPNYFDKDGNFKIDEFKTMLQEDEVDLTKEGYELDFLGKSYARYETSLETETVVTPDTDHNNLEKNKDSENLYIVGDNIDALKHLLKSYANKIKCIYIDPPYNTGSDGFVYPDNFKFTAEELTQKLGIEEEEANRILNLNGKSTHSAWMTFMYPRLTLARDLLTEDGIIFISIDDNEQANLKLLCDEIFGEENFICNFSWRKKTGANDSKDLAVITESILAYSKNKQQAIENDIYNRDFSSINTSRYNKKDEYFEDRGYFYYDTLDRGGLQYSESLNYAIDLPDGKKLYPNSRREFVNDGWIWKWSKDKVKWGIEKGFIEFIKIGDEYTIKYKVYELVDNKGKPRKQRGRAYSNLILEPINQEGTNELKEHFDGISVFTNPKPVNLVRYLVNIIVSNECIVLDFFSGSATTAEVIMKLNSQDSGKRKYIMVQLPERIIKDKPAYSLGFKTIDEIGRERIKRAAEKIKAKSNADIDYGFKLYRLNEPTQSTINDLVEFDPNQDQMELLSQDFITPFEFDGEKGEATILTTWLNQDGYGLLAEAEDYQLDKYQAKKYQNSLYMIESGLTSEDIMELVKALELNELQINRVVVYSYSLEFNIAHELKTNLANLQNNKSVSLIERY